MIKVDPAGIQYNHKVFVLPATMPDHLHQTAFMQSAS